MFYTIIYYFKKKINFLLEGFFRKKISYRVIGIRVYNFFSRFISILVALKSNKWAGATLIISKSLFFFKALSEHDCPACIKLKKDIIPDYFTGQFDVPVNFRSAITSDHPHYYKLEYTACPGGRLAAIKRFLARYRHEWWAHDDGSGIVHDVFIDIGVPDNIHPPLLVGIPDWTIIDKQLALAKELPSYWITKNFELFFDFIEYLEKGGHFSFILVMTVVSFLLVLIISNSRNFIISGFLINLIDDWFNTILLYLGKARWWFNKKIDRFILKFKEELHYFKKNYYIWKITWVVKRFVVRFIGRSIFKFKTLWARFFK